MKGNWILNTIMTECERESISFYYLSVDEKEEIDKFKQKLNSVHNKIQALLANWEGLEKIIFSFHSTSTHNTQFVFFFIFVSFFYNIFLYNISLLFCDILIFFCLIYEFLFRVCFASLYSLAQFFGDKLTQIVFVILF
jgi:hypothetical protein